MNILVLGASGFLGGIVYKRFSREPDINVIGTSFRSKRANGFMTLDVTNKNEVQCVMEGFDADAVIWSLTSKTSEKYLIEIGLNNIIQYLPHHKKLIFMSTNAVFNDGSGHHTEDDIPIYKNSNKPIALYSNAKIDGEKIVRKLDNYIIIRPGAIYGQDINGCWDKRISVLIDKLGRREEIVRTKNMFNTFVKVDELAYAMLCLIKMGYKGIIHLGPENRESYYNYYREMAINLKLDYNLIKGNTIEADFARENGFSLDESLDTSKCRALLGGIFTDV